MSTIERLELLTATAAMRYKQNKEMMEHAAVVASATIGKEKEDSFGKEVSEDYLDKRYGRMKGSFGG